MRGSHSPAREGSELSDSPLKRGVFGYTSKSVGLLLADRNRMFLEAAEESRVALARVADLEEAVKAAEQELDQGTKELRTALEAAEALRSELEATRNVLENSRADGRLHEERVDELEAALGQRDADSERARSAEAEVDGLRTQLERVTDALRQQDDRAAAREALTEQLRTELEQTRGRIGSAHLETQAAVQRAEAAEARNREVEAELASTKSALEGSGDLTASLQADLEESRRDVASLRSELEVRLGSTPLPPERIAGEAATAGEVSALLRSTEEAMARIIEEARVRSDEELQEAELVRAEIQDETEQLRAWRDRVSPLVGEVRLSVEQARTRSTDLRDRVHEALDSMTDTIMALGVRLEELGQVAAIPTKSTQGAEIDTGFPRVIEIREPEAAVEGLSDGPESVPSGDQVRERQW
jgi:DNA repair exonuclease SbcCD ATPase subunit